jgi:hypothetical protein
MRCPACRIISNILVSRILRSLGGDHDESDLAWRIRAIAPGMVGAALNKAIPDA